MVSLGGPPGDTLQGGDTRIKFKKKLWVNSERTVDKWGRTAKKSLQMATTKKGRQFFQENIGATPSVAAPGDTNPSNAAVHGPLYM